MIVKFFLALSFLFLLVAFRASADTWRPATDCRANIRAVTCKVAGWNGTLPMESRQDRACIDGADFYVTELEKVYDELPIKFQKGFCHLRKIFLEEDSPDSATGYADSYFEQIEENGETKYRANGLILGLTRQRNFDLGWGITDWFHHREQLTFGRKFHDQPLADLQANGWETSGFNSKLMLFYVVIHEFGHFLDFAQEVNASNPSEWAALSWVDGQVRAEDRYFDPMACFWNCTPDRVVAVPKAAEFYRALATVNSFVSLYATASPGEDFAETLAQFTLMKYFNQAPGSQRFAWHSVTVPGFPQEVFTMADRMSRGRVAEKWRYMERFDQLDWRYEKANQPVLKPHDLGPFTNLCRH